MNNFPDLYFDYVGATGEHSINDYIDYTSNNNYSYTSNSSNILDNKIIITSNYLNSNIISIDDKYKVLIKEETEGILKHTYITNSNIQGQIKFITRFNSNDYRYKTRIRENGEIEVYYPEFNILYPTVFVGWYSVMNSIRDAYNYQVVAGELIGGVMFSINDIYQKYYGLVASTGASLSSITAGQLTKEAFANITIQASRAVNYNKYNNVQAILGITGLGAAAFVYSFLNGVRYDNITNNLLSNLSNLDLNVYSNITQTEKDTALSNLINDANSNIIETNNNLSNLVLFNGFTNSNTITQQYLNSININELKLNQTNISNIFVASNVLSNINLNQGFTNSNIITTQYLNSINTNEIKMNNLNFSNIFVASNVLDNTYNTLSNLTSNSSNFNFNYASNLSFNSSNNLINNYSKNIRLILPNTNFIFDATNNIFKYDLDISKYVPFKLIQQSATLFIKTRIFRITTFLSTDFNLLQNTNLNNLTGNPICYPETLLIYMSNDKNISGIHTADDTICNGLIYGKQNPNIYAGYWNIVPTNFNYLRFITGIGFDMNLIIEPILF
jgi:hypothetical protein